MFLNRFFVQAVKNYALATPSTHTISNNLLQLQTRHLILSVSWLTSKHESHVLYDDQSLISLASKINDTVRTQTEKLEFTSKFNLPKETINLFQCLALNNDQIAVKSEALHSLRHILDNKTFSILEEIFSGTCSDKKLPFYVKCSGCGTILQSNNRLQPGFISIEQITKAKKLKILNDTRCKRCTALRMYDVALATTIKPKQFKQIVARSIKSNKNSAALVMIDLSDVTSRTLYELLSGILHQKTEVLLVGNKFDLIPPDSTHYDIRIKDFLKESCKFIQEQVKGVHLISAKTGYGVAYLITTMQRLWWSRRDIYLIGPVNVGKSTLFNAFLGSDLCRGEALELFEKATVSKWPGTTLNTLKFPLNPVTNPKLSSRNILLKKNDTIQNSYHIQNTSHAQDTVARVMIGGLPELRSDKYYKSPFDFDCQNTFMQQYSDDVKWFHDTPGILSKESILPELNPSELQAVIPSAAFVPRIYSLSPNQAISFGGLGKIEYTEGSNDLLLFLFSSLSIPVVIAGIDETNNHSKSWISSGKLSVPSTLERFNQLGGFYSIDLDLISERNFHAMCDIIFASTGWFTVVLRSKDDKASLKNYCLNSKPTLRNPLLQDVYNLIGKRQKNSPKFNLRKDYDDLIKFGKLFFNERKRSYSNKKTSS